MKADYPIARLLIGILLIVSGGCKAIALPPPTAITPRQLNVSSKQLYIDSTSSSLNHTEQITAVTQAVHAFVNLNPNIVHQSIRITETIKFDSKHFTIVTELEVGGNQHQVTSDPLDGSHVSESHLYVIDGNYYCQRAGKWQQDDLCLNPDGGAFRVMGLMLLGMLLTPDPDAVQIQAVQQISQTELSGEPITIYHYISQLEPYHTTANITLWLQTSNNCPRRALMIGTLPVTSDQLQPIQIEWTVEYDPSIVIKAPT